MESSNHPIERKDFEALIHAIGFEIEHAQVKLIVAANAQMLFHYWKLGNFILYHQKRLGWGGKVISQISKAIKMHYPEKKGYSARSLTYMCQFARTYPLEILQRMLSCDKVLRTPTIPNMLSLTDELNCLPITQEPLAQFQTNIFQSKEFTQEPLAQIQKIDKTISAMLQTSIDDIEKDFVCSPISKINWTSHVILLDSSLPLGNKYWYMKQSVENGWSSNVLKIQIETNLFKRQIETQKVNNFTKTLPAPQSDLANYLLKDPYIFDMLTFTDQYNERDVEIGLVKHVEKFLVEMGAGFAFMGRQYHIEVSGDDYYIDILMYNAFLHRYLVIELKDTEFMPEYIGKLNFYCSAVDDILCREGDNRTIGLLLCKSKDRIKAEYALRDIQKPIGISDYELGHALPKDFRGSLPTIEEIEKELASDNQ